MSNSITLKFKHQFKGAQGFNLDVDLNLPSSGITALFGHSGSGKTTLLRCIAGLQTTHEGYCALGDQLWQEGKKSLPTHKRPLGYVFQEASLFSHLNARQNLNYAVTRASPGTPLLSFDDAVDLMGIGHLLNQSTELLSGGERQRVAIARALLINPQLLLMDEPLAALDMARKQDILPYLERLKTEVKIPIIYVSHAVDEVARLADYLVVMEDGKVTTQGPLQDCLSSLESPVTLGDDTSVIIEGAVARIDTEYQRVCLDSPAGSIWLQAKSRKIGEQLRIRILARDVSLSLKPHIDTSISNILPATVLDYRLIEDDAAALVRLQTGTDIVISKITRRSLDNLQISGGQAVWAQIKSVALIR